MSVNSSRVCSFPRSTGKVQVSLAPLEAAPSVPAASTKTSKEIRMTVDISDIRAIVQEQDEWRGGRTINLIASENAQSPAVREIQNSDFMARYAEGHPNQGDQVNRYYQGTKYIDQIE